MQHYSYKTCKNGHSILFIRLDGQMSFLVSDEGSMLLSLTSKWVCLSSLWCKTAGGTRP